MVNAFLVAGYLMHLLSEKKMIYTVLAFTVFFFAGLMGLTIWATQRFSDRHGDSLTMSLKAFHLIFVTLLTALSFGCAAWAFPPAACFGAWRASPPAFGDRLRHLFFEETEKNQLPVKSVPHHFISALRRGSRADESCCLRRVLRQVGFGAWPRA